MKALGKRLAMIADQVTQPYAHIWDCCCDHGQLGVELLQRYPHSNVHFVDCVPELMTRLENNLYRYLSADQHRWQVHCEDVSQLSLPATDTPQLVIIAGVGGDLTLDLVQQIAARHPHQAVEFLLCPVYHIYRLRSALRDAGFHCLNEVLVEENRRFYEILHISQTGHQALSVTGDTLWQPVTDQNQRYLAQLIQHYQRSASHSTGDQAALCAYQQLSAQREGVID